MNFFTKDTLGKLIIKRTWRDLPGSKVCNCCKSDPIVKSTYHSSHHNLEIFNFIIQCVAQNGDNWALRYCDHEGSPPGRFQVPVTGVISAAITFAVVRVCNF